MTSSELSLAQPVRHGGDLAEARRRFPDAPEPWIDLSTGINPVPYRLQPFESAALTRLPSPEEVAALEAVAAAAYGVADPAEVVAAPGTQSLIERLPYLLAPPTGARVAVIGPTYAEHARSWRRAGHPVDAITPDEMAGAVADAGIGCIVLVNPNNPDGRIVPRGDLAPLAAALAERVASLVVDEAFLDFEDAAGTLSLARERPGRAVILRSFGKTYGLAGLRLGFAVAAPALAARLRDALGPWAVSGPAIAAGSAALADRTWLAPAAAARAVDAARLDALLRGWGEVVGGTRLFRLLRARDAGRLFERLGRRGIWVRAFAHDPGLLRFGLPAPAGWARLEAALDPG